MSNNAEVLTKDHRLITELQILKIDNTMDQLYTLVPRNLHGTPIPFEENQNYALIQSDQTNIAFYDVQFLELSSHENNPTFKFQIINKKIIENARKEERKNVECETVISDFEKVDTGVVLDISKSGLKLETDQPHISEFVELFFDDANIPRRAFGRIVWQKKNEEKDTFLYGISLEYR